MIVVCQLTVLTFFIVLILSVLWALHCEDLTLIWCVRQALLFMMTLPMPVLRCGPVFNATVCCCIMDGVLWPLFDEPTPLFRLAAGRGAWVMQPWTLVTVFSMINVPSTLTGLAWCRCELYQQRIASQRYTQFILLLVVVWQPNKRSGINIIVDLAVVCVWPIIPWALPVLW